MTKTTFTAGNGMDYRPQVRLGLAALAVMAIVIVAWSILAPLESGAVAPGKIVVDTNRRVIQHPDGGVITSINVSDGDTVRHGDILVELDLTDAEAQRNRVYSEWLALLARQSRLQSELAGETSITFPDVFHEPGMPDRKKEQMSLQDSLAKARRDNLDNELEIHAQRKARLQEQITGLEQQNAANDKRIGLLNEEISDLDKLKKKEYISKTRLLEMNRELAEAQAQSAKLKASVAELRVKIGETDLEIIRVTEQFRESISTELSTIRTEIHDTEERLRSIEQRLDRTRIRAPSDGIIFNSQVHTIGGVISPGEPIMEIVPIRERLLVEAEVSPRDIEAVHTGHEASVRFTGLSSRNTPLLSGRVDFVAADTHKNAHNNDVFKIRVVIGNDELARLGNIELVPGLPVEVLIRKSTRTLLEYLLQPISAALFRGFKED